MLDVRSNAIAEFQRVLGADRVQLDAAVLRAASTATLATSPQVLAIIEPATRDELQACMQIADHYRQPLEITSGGKNWGYGSRVPLQEDSVLMSLGRLNRITRFDPDLASVTIEPGVTFRQLATFLQSQGSSLFVRGPGSSFDASVVGNTLERGIALGPLGDRCDHVAGLEVMLADGRRMQTGSRCLPGSQTSHLHKWGIGPALEGLFFQSNLGLVTELSLFLAPMPEFYRGSVMRIPRSQLPAAVDSLQQLRLHGVLDAGCALHNGSRRAAAGQPTDGPVDDWWLSTAITACSGPELISKQEFVQQKLAGHGSLQWTRMNQDSPFFGSGFDDDLDLAYHGKPAGRPDAERNPDRDRCGVIWANAAVPFRGSTLAEALKGAQPVLENRGFDAAFSVHGISSRCLYLMAPVLFDRDQSGADSHALSCQVALYEAWSAMGFYPYRATPPIMSDVMQALGDDGWLLSRLKALLDPNGILSPGRYQA